MGLVGGLSTQNVWALFAGQDYSYNNYAVRASYWPRLYAAGVPDQGFRPIAAEGMPGEVSQEGAFHAASIPLRDGLHWSDGT